MLDRSMSAEHMCDSFRDMIKGAQVVFKNYIFT